MPRATNKKKISSWMEESDRWDEMSVEAILAISEPDDDIKFIDARPKKAISIRLDEGVIDAGKQAARDMGLGYQTLFRMWLIEGLRRHHRQRSADRPAPKARRAS